VWTGTRMGPERMTRETGIPSRALVALDATLDSLLDGAGTLGVVGDLAGDGFATRDQQFIDALHRDHPNFRIVDANELVANLRMRHSAAELALERKAIDITMHGDGADYLRELRERIGMIDITPDDEAVPALQLLSSSA